MTNKKQLVIDIRWFIDQFKQDFLEYQEYVLQSHRYKTELKPRYLCNINGNRICLSTESTSITRIALCDSTIEINPIVASRVHTDSLFYFILWCFMVDDLDDEYIETDNKAIVFIKNECPNFKLSNVMNDIITIFAEVDTETNKNRITNYASATFVADDN